MDAGGAGGTVTYHALDMNDVTILAPLPQSVATPVLLRATDLADDGTPLVSRMLFDQVVRDRDSSTGQPLPFPTMPYELLQLVAVRFDLCDRHLPGPCPPAEDARMRLVFQPLADANGAQDVGFHAFYTVRNDEIGDAVAALRALAMMAPPQAGALRVSPALSAADPAPYASRLRTFVQRYGGAARIVRLTMNAQSFKSEAVAWALQGIEKQAGAFVDMTIVGSTRLTQSVILSGTSSYDIVPMTETPSGLLSALSQAVFERADAPQKREFLAALVATENPLSHTAETVACIGCHVSTVVMAARAPSASIDPLSLPGRYSSTFELSTAAGQSATTPRTLRALGYFGKTVLISQRVANETAQTLTEIEQWFPAP